MENAGEKQTAELTNGSPYGLSDTQPASDLPFDAAKYIGQMEDSDSTEEQKVEFLQNLWAIMKAFVDLGFGVDSVQKLFPEILTIPSETGADRVEFEDKKNTQEFKKAVLDLAAEGGDS